MRPHKPNPPFTFHQKPRATLRIPHTPSYLPLTLTQVPLRNPGRGSWGICSQSKHRTRSDFIHIAKQNFNTEVSICKLLTRHRELRAFGPKLKWQLLAPLAQKKNLLSHFLLCHISWWGMYSHAFDTATFNHALMSPVHNFSLAEIYSTELHYMILMYTSHRVLPSLFFDTP